MSLNTRSETVTTTPAAARTDTLAASARPVPVSGSERQARRTGLAVLGGSLVWAATMVTVGNNPESSIGISINDFGGLLFQGGLFALVGLQLATRATGTSRLAVGMLRVERVLLSLAMLWTVLHGAVPAFRDDVWLAVLDAFWPLSMLGMAIIGVKIAFAGRWRGLARIWPVVAESWAPVVIPAFAVLGAGRASDFVGAGHLLIGYCTLGLILALRPHLTGAAR
jgi:hypothetical protein